jgi:hypothetical protein
LEIFYSVHRSHVKHLRPAFFFHESKTFKQKLQKARSRSSLFCSVFRYTPHAQKLFLKRLYGQLMVDPMKLILVLSAALLLQLPQLSANILKDFVGNWNYVEKGFYEVDHSEGEM